MATNSRAIALYYATHDGQSRRIAEHIHAAFRKAARPACRKTWR